MRVNRALKKLQRIGALPARIKSRWLSGSLPESVYFYTFHKCASTLFSSYILKNIKGLEHVDYASQIYDNRRPGRKELIFRKRGYVYGPIRLSSNPEGPVHKILVTPTSDLEFIRDKIAVCFVRDPRDILVSAYYSFGYTHGFSQVKKIQGNQQARRDSVQGKSLDEYVLEHAALQAKNFQTVIELARVSERGVILKYEDMICNFGKFMDELSTDIVMDKDVIEEIYKRSRPKQIEDTNSHRRSGHVGGFREKLKAETILSLNKNLEEVLEILEYPV